MFVHILICQASFGLKCRAWFIRRYNSDVRVLFSRTTLRVWIHPLFARSELINWYALEATPRHYQESRSLFRIASASTTLPTIPCLSLSLTDVIPPETHISIATVSWLAILFPDRTTVSILPDYEHHVRSYALVTSIHSMWRHWFSCQYIAKRVACWLEYRICWALDRLGLLLFTSLSFVHNATSFQINGILRFTCFRISAYWACLITFTSSPKPRYRPLHWISASANLNVRGRSIKNQ